MDKHKVRGARAVAVGLGVRDPLARPPKAARVGVRSAMLACGRVPLSLAERGERRALLVLAFFVLTAKGGACGRASARLLRVPCAVGGAFLSVRGVRCGLCALFARSLGGMGRLCALMRFLLRPRRGGVLRFSRSGSRSHVVLEVFHILCMSL